MKGEKNKRKKKEKKEKEGEDYPHLTIKRRKDK